MSKIKEIADKSAGRVIIATLPKQQPTENGQEVKTPNAQDDPKEKQQDKHQEKPQKSLAEMQADFERLKNLFFRKSRFENALERLKDFGKNISQSKEDIENDGFKLVLSSNLNRDEVRINNVVVISDCIKFLSARIESTVEGIEADILNS